MNWANIAPVMFLCIVISAVFGQHYLDCGLCANIVCIACLIVLRNVGPRRPREHCVGYFPAKTCLRAQDQYCTSNFLVQFLPDVFGQQCVYDIPMKEWLSVNHWPTLHRYFPCAILAQID